MSKIRVVSSALLLSLALLGVGLVATPVAAKELVFVSWGGAYQEAIRKAWLKPFSEQTGIRIIEDTGPELAKIKAMVDTGTVTWDVVTGGASGLVRGTRQGLFEPIPFDVVKRDHVYPAGRHEYGVPSEIFSHVFCFPTTTFPDGKVQPRTWADFWDVKRFPGKRSFYSKPSTSLEIALMADGVSPSEVYRVLRSSEGVDRAFKKMAEIKPHVVQWWTSGSQPVQALGSGEVTIAMAPNGRCQVGITQGLPLKIAWDGAVAEMGFFMIVKGAKNKEQGLKFLQYMVSPEAQAEFHKHISYGPVTPSAWERIPKDKWAILPSSPQNLERSVFVDIDWWVDNEAKMMERWQAFLQQ